MDLASAERAVFATLLWHIRILAGWGPPLGAGPLRLLAAGFEIANVTDHLAALAGRPIPEPYELGSMANAWTAVSAATTPADVRAALATSPWGDPGGEDPATIRLALLFSWARRVFDGVPGAAEWATSGAALLVSRVVNSGALPDLSPSAQRDARHLLGPHWQEVSGAGQPAQHLAKAAAKILEGITGADELWRAEARWWSTVAASGKVLLTHSPPDVSCSVGAVGVLAADAWRARAALQIAARGGGDIEELLGAVA
jgi:hypothetical protein